MRMISWNVNGIRASWNHGLSSLIDSYDADIYAFQETKTSEAIPLVEANGYFPYWAFCQSRKGYSGTLVLTKQKPLNVRYDIGDDTFDTEGRIITLEFDDFFFVNCYVPNSQHSKLRYDYRTEWDSLLIDFLRRLQQRKSIIVCGDFNVPISDKDIDKVNKKIDGWVTYHKVSEAENAFRKMDVYISALLLELCEKKHPKWDKEKILERYWYVDANGRHHYALTDKKEISVKFLADTLYVNYFPVRTHFNSYIDLEYMERRSKERKILNVTGVYRSIWNRQNGKCYYCGRKILRDEEKRLTEICSKDRRMTARNVYVHARCMDGTVEYIDTDALPSSLNDVMDLLEKLESNQRPLSQKYFALSEFFRTREKNSVTLTFK